MLVTHLRILLFLLGRKENSQQIPSCLCSVAKRVRKNQKGTHDNSQIDY